MLLAPDSLNFGVLVLLSASVGFVGYRWLLPRLPRFYTGLALGFFAAQILAFALWAGIRVALHPVEGSALLYAVDRFASLLSTTQLALIGVVALITALMSRRQPAWQRLYWLALALVFPYIGLDDYFDWKALWHIDGLEKPFVLLGLAVAAATVMAALRSSSPARQWHWWTLAGLTLAGAGGFAFDGLPDICGQFGFLRLDGCLGFRFAEEALEFLGFWLALLAALGHLSAAAPKPSRWIRLAICALPALAALIFISNAVLPQLVSPSSATVISRPAEAEDRQRDAIVVDDELPLSSADAAPSPDEPRDQAAFGIWSHQLIYPFLFVLYAAVGVISFQWLIPGLMPWAARLASLMFAAQVLIVAVALGIQPASVFDEWLWNLGQEYNIPSMFASSQLALVGIVALFAAWYAGPHSTALRLYLAVTGLVFIFVARDEYLVIHEKIQHWERYYARAWHGAGGGDGANGFAFATAPKALASLLSDRAGDERGWRRVI